MFRRPIHDEVMAMGDGYELIPWLGPAHSRLIYKWGEIKNFALWQH
jgi:hypothetical protein